MSMRLSSTLLSSVATVITLAVYTGACAHTVSNSYLTIQAGDSKLFRAQWDISLRDLNFVIGLDDNGDGKVTWGELKNHQQGISDYAHKRLHIGHGGDACTLTPQKQWVDTHADGAYAVLFFDIDCPAKGPRVLTLDDSLLFEVDPTHRDILVFRDGDETSTALLSPDKHKIELKLPTRGG